jgi:Uma2 family endonuclease
MGEVGVFRPGARVELIEGEVIEMTPVGPDHADAVNDLTELLVTTFRDRAKVAPQSPVLLDPYTLPQPDIALLARRSYRGRHPTPEDVLLIIEVGDSTVLDDRRRKVPLYAKHGIREVWLVSLPAQSVTVYREPSPEGYTSSSELARGQSLCPLAFPDRELAVGELLGLGES